MRDSIPTPCACNPQVLYRSDGQFFIRDPESGHSYPASRGHVLGRFGEQFMGSVEEMSGLWIAFEPDARAEPVSPPFPTPLQVAMANVAAVDAITPLATPHQQRISVPDIRPGVPGNHVISIEFLVLRHEIDAFLVQRPDVPSKSVWLPWSKVVKGRFLRDQHRVIAGTKQVWWPVHGFDVPVWLWRKVREQFLADKPKGR